MEKSEQLAAMIVELITHGIGTQEPENVKVLLTDLIGDVEREAVDGHTHSIC